MGKQPDKTGRTKAGSDPKHVRLYHWMLQSHAYRSLSLGARALLVQLYDRYHGNNNGHVYLSQREAAESLAMKDRKAIGNYFAELEAKGFIRTRLKGSFSNKTRLATSYVLTEYEYAGQRPSKTFMSWRPQPKPQKARRRKAGPTGEDSLQAGEKYIPDDWPDGSANLAHEACLAGVQS